mgnify:CR=1 FL=1
MRITLPLLSPTIWMVALTSMIHTAKTYNEVYSLFTGYGGGGDAGPGNSAITIVYYIYYQFNARKAVNYAAAAAIFSFELIHGERVSAHDGKYHDTGHVEDAAYRCVEDIAHERCHFPESSC